MAPPEEGPAVEKTDKELLLQYIDNILLQYIN